VHSSFFDVFHDATNEDFTAGVSDCINIDFGRIVEKAID
jgi:hypothetical protein